MQGLICEHYRLTEKLGEGGIAEVWSAEHIQIGHKVAIKLLLPHLSERDELARRFLKEAKAVAAIRHPGVIQIFGYGNSEDDRAFISMEYLPGEALSDCLQREGKLSIERAVQLMRQLANALSAAHDQKIWHRDLKPENLFLVPDPETEGEERLKVLDFGLAKLNVELAESSATVPGSIFGTPAYMAPEQCLDAGSVDGRADLYSIGCIFYRCLTGRRPFEVHDHLALIQAQLKDMPDPPRRYRPEIPAHIDALIMRLLAKQPDERVQTCAQLLVELDDTGVPVDLSAQDSAEVKTLVFDSDIGRASLARSMVNGPMREALGLPALAPADIGPEAGAMALPGTPPGAPYPHPWPRSTPAPRHSNSSISGSAGQFRDWARDNRVESGKRQRGLWVVAALVVLIVALVPALECLPSELEHGDAAVFDGGSRSSDPDAGRTIPARGRSVSAAEMSDSNRERLAALLRQAESANRERRYEDAYDACEKALEIDPKSRAGHSACAYAACGLKDVDRARYHLGEGGDMADWFIDLCLDRDEGPPERESPGKRKPRTENPPDRETPED